MFGGVRFLSLAYTFSDNRNVYVSYCRHGGCVS